MLKERARCIATDGKLPERVVPLRLREDRRRIRYELAGGLARTPAIDFRPLDLPLPEKARSEELQAAAGQHPAAAARIGEQLLRLVPLNDPAEPEL
jgi:hypothetical protein